MAKKELDEESLRLLEDAVGEREFFAGKRFGFVDIVRSLFLSSLSFMSMNDSGA